jgi:hypothetical protein
VDKVIIDAEFWGSDGVGTTAKETRKQGTRNRYLCADDQGNLTGGEDSGVIV